MFSFFKRFSAITLNIWTLVTGGACGANGRCHDRLVWCTRTRASRNLAGLLMVCSWLARRNACVSFPVRCKMFPCFHKISQNRHEMTRAGVFQKAADSFLRGAYWTPPIDWHDTAMTRNDTHFWKQTRGNQSNMHILLWIPHDLLVQDLIKGCLVDTRSTGCLLDTR